MNAYMHKVLVPNSGERKILQLEFEVNHRQYSFVQSSTLALLYYLFECFKTAFLLQLTPHVYRIFLYTYTPRLLVWWLWLGTTYCFTFHHPKKSVFLVMLGLLTSLLLHSEHFFLWHPVQKLLRTKELKDVCFINWLSFY